MTTKQTNSPHYHADREVIWATIDVQCQHQYLSLRWFQNVIWLWLSLPWFYSGSRRTRTNYTEIGSQSSQLTHTQSVRLRPVDLLLRIFRHSCDSVTLLRISGTRQFSKCVETIKYIYFLGQIVKATVSSSRWICLSVLVNAVSPSWHGFHVSSPFRRSSVTSSPWWCNCITFPGGCWSVFPLPAGRRIIFRSFPYTKLMAL